MKLSEQKDKGGSALSVKIMHNLEYLSWQQNQHVISPLAVQRMKWVYKKVNIKYPTNIREKTTQNCFQITPSKQSFKDEKCF